ncbi:MAG TPA: MFS transporter [Bryobacteraceae bacterium]|nr:MFS transporter [Bryobacteraceae bacterium]
MTPSRAAPARPTAVRFGIAALLFGVITLTFIDRFNMNVAAHAIQLEFDLSDIQIGTLLSAFVLGYALFQIPGGMLCDRFGPRRALFFAILAWSAGTALTAAAPDLPWLGIIGSFWVFRFMVGVGEAPAFPSANKMVGLWMAPHERARGTSLFILGVGAGGTLAPPIIAWVVQEFGWRVNFLACGALGVLVACAWRAWSSETPASDPRVNDAERALIGPPAAAMMRFSEVPWRRILASRSVWALAASNFLLGYVSYIFYTWFYLYVVNVRKLPVIEGSYWATAPFLVMATAAPLGGYVSDRLVRTSGLCWGRRLPVMGGAIAACLLLVAGGRLENPYWAIAVLAVAGGCNTFAAVVHWALPLDLARSCSGSLSGLLNCANNLGGTLSPILTPAIAAAWGWTTALDVAAFAILAMGALWFFVSPDHKLSTSF